MKTLEGRIQEYLAQVKEPRPIGERFAHLEQGWLNKLLAQQKTHAAVKQLIEIRDSTPPQADERNLRQMTPSPSRDAEYILAKLRDIYNNYETERNLLHCLAPALRR